VCGGGGGREKEHRRGSQKSEHLAILSTSKASGEGFFRAFFFSLNTWVYSERNAVTHLPGLLSSSRVLSEQKVSFQKFKRKKRKLSQERLLSEKTPRFLF
jgi:hypothetical protein